jgi:S1-C subfamily serine protease
MVPYSVQRYDFLATYWARNSKIRLGIVYLNLPAEMRQRLQRNTGVVADLIIRESPAFISNILVGDVILKMNDEDVIDVNGFSRMLDRYAGTLVRLTIVRGSDEKTIQIRLND